MAWLIQGTLPKTVETLDSVLAFCMALLKVLQKPHVQVWGAISADTLWGKGVFAVIQRYHTSGQKRVSDFAKLANY
ncbi:hypothetical protein [Vibrio sp. STUT-A16]|uniref:hypothetical protein n=1 Tax=Vibrio sp. STUT-A16 TaxID=2976237 RepID=UPI00222F3239|nr:hypothetical protein [Vibrio sp. STUT-A16]BDR21432.1 hypothetical protein VspSTUT16_47780 [Vibrio sp. STUT-A16]